MTVKLKLEKAFWEARAYEYYPSTKLKKVWAVELDLLNEFDRVCGVIGVKYFLVYGSLLGAKRHGGFVPWDDDIDVGMLRNDYDRLCECAARHFAYPYFFQTNVSDPGSARGHAQLRNSETTGMLKSEMVNGIGKFTFNQGMFLDIFVFDNIPDEKEECDEFLDVMQGIKEDVEKNKRHRDNAIQLRYNLTLSNIVRFILRDVWAMIKARIMRIDLLNDSCRMLEVTAKRYSNIETKCVAPITFMPRSDRFCPLPIEVFDQLERVPFCGLKVWAPKNYQVMLERSYGDWHEHVVGGSAHGGVLFDTEHPYTDYLKK